MALVGLRVESERAGKELLLEQYEVLEVVDKDGREHHVRIGLHVLAYPRRDVLVEASEQIRILALLLLLLLLLLIALAGRVALAVAAAAAAAVAVGEHDVGGQLEGAGARGRLAVALVVEAAQLADEHRLVLSLLARLRRLRCCCTVGGRVCS